METRKALVVIVWRPDVGAHQKKVLILRVNPDRGGFWQTVTGKMEEGESFADGALREAKEETGLIYSRLPQYLGLEYRFPSRWGGMAHERAFYLPLFGGSEPPAPTLDGKEHDAFEWVSPEEAMKRVKFPSNQQAIERAAKGVPPVLLSRKGSLFQDGEEITHERTLDLFMRSLAKNADGTFSVKIHGEELDVIVEDTPLFVLRYDRSSGKISLSNGQEEVLKPETIRVRADHSFECTAANGWAAAFLSPAYYEISKDITEGSRAGEYLLHFLGRHHEIRVANEGEGIDR